jgi:hypothetical protein
MFIFLEKAKEAPNLNVKILCPEGQINIYITPKKTPNIPFFQFQMYFIEKTIPQLHA